MSDKLWMVPKDKEERHRWMAMIVRASIAFEVRMLRLSRGWTQEELAAKCDESTPTISRIENPEGSWMRLATLEKIARAFDVALLVRFASWEEFVQTMPIPAPAYEAEPTP